MPIFVVCFMVAPRSGRAHRFSDDDVRGNLGNLIFFGGDDFDLSDMEGNDNDTYKEDTDNEGDHYYGDYDTDVLGVGLVADENTSPWGELGSDFLWKLCGSWSLLYACISF